MKHDYFDTMIGQPFGSESKEWHKVFQQKFEAHIEDSTKYKQYVRRMPYNMWDSKLPVDLDTEVVPMKSIHLTIDNLERLVRQQEFIENLERDAEYGKKVVNMLRADERVRDDNPAVAKAYRNYLTLLELARK
jgi:hypothetical protein